VTSAADADDAVYLPLAGPKGYGLALLVDVLSAALAGGPIGRELDGSGEQSARVSLFVLAIDPESFGGSAAFADAVDRLARQVRETTPLDPARPVRLPGDRGVAEERRRRADGIPIDRVLWDRMEAELRELGVDIDAQRPFTKEDT
jgi:LDH2 family malate/lactate/ureidoglycolate dehydrogenase